MYFPLKYYKGLTNRKKTMRKNEIAQRSKLSWKTRKAYLPFKTDKGIKTRKSKYVSKWKQLFPDSHGLPDASKNTGVPLSILKESYNRGMAAWRTGHRPGATQEQWGYARVYSMLTCGKTHYTTDSDLVRKARKTLKGKRWFQRC